jgi:Ni/Co efflux regulator RcnB
VGACCRPLVGWLVSDQTRLSIANVAFQATLLRSCASTLTTLLDAAPGFLTHGNADQGWNFKPDAAEYLLRSGFEPWSGDGAYEQSDEWRSTCAARTRATSARGAPIPDCVAVGCSYSTTAPLLERLVQALDRRVIRRAGQTRGQSSRGSLLDVARRQWPKKAHYGTCAALRYAYPSLSVPPKPSTWREGQRIPSRWLNVGVTSQRWVECNEESPAAYRQMQGTWIPRLQQHGPQG